MRYSSRIKPTSYIKANAAKVSMEPGIQRHPMIITWNGEDRAVLQDVV